MRTSPALTCEALSVCATRPVGIEDAEHGIRGIASDGYAEFVTVDLQVEVGIGGYTSNATGLHGSYLHLGLGGVADRVGGGDGKRGRTLTHGELQIR